jgi:hypothetical protein
MILLTSTSDIVRVTTGSAAAVDAHASWMDNASGTVTPGRTNTANISTATTTTVVGSPASSTQRNVKNLTLANTHASVSTTVVVEHSDGTNVETLWSGTLAAGEQVVLDELGVWTQYDVNGLVKLAAARLDAKLVVSGSDVTNSTTSFADVTGLTVATKAGIRYNFETHLYHQTAATTTGAQFGVNHSGAATALIIAAIQQITSSVTAATYGSSAAVTAVDTAAVVETTGPGTSNFLAIMSGYIVPTADGTFAVRCKSEVAASALTIKVGSWLRIWQADN